MQELIVFTLKLAMTLFLRIKKRDIGWSIIIKNSIKRNVNNPPQDSFNNPWENLNLALKERSIKQYNAKNVESELMGQALQRETKKEK